MSKSVAKMSKSVAKKEFPNAVCNPPSWLPNRVTVAQNEKIEEYRDMHAAFVREVAPQGPVEWLLLDEYVKLQWEVMRYRRWEEELIRAAGFDGVKRAFRARFRVGGGTEEELDYEAARLARYFETNPKIRNPLGPDLIEAEAYLSRQEDLASIHKRVVSAERRRNAALREIEGRRERLAKRLAETSRSFMAALAQGTESGMGAVPETRNGAPGSCPRVTPRRNGANSMVRVPLNGN